MGRSGPILSPKKRSLGPNRWLCRTCFCGQSPCGWTVTKNPMSPNIYLHQRLPPNFSRDPAYYLRKHMQQRSCPCFRSHCTQMHAKVLKLQAMLAHQNFPHRSESYISLSKTLCVDVVATHSYTHADRINLAGKFALTSTVCSPNRTNAGDRTPASYRLPFVPRRSPLSPPPFAPVVPPPSLAKMKTVSSHIPCQ